MWATPWQYGNYASFTHDLIIQFPLKLLKAPCERQNACLVAIKLGGIRPIFHLPIWVASLTYSNSKLKFIIRFLGCWTGNQDFVLWKYIPTSWKTNKSSFGFMENFWEYKIFFLGFFCQRENILHNIKFYFPSVWFQFS